MTSLHERIKNARKARRITQKEAADLIGVSERMYQRYEKDIEPSVDDIKKLGAAFGTDLLSENEQDGKGRTLEVERTIILEALMRSVLVQFARDRAANAGEPENWKDYHRDIDRDTVEEMNKIALRLGLPRS